MTRQVQQHPSVCLVILLPSMEAGRVTKVSNKKVACTQTQEIAVIHYNIAGKQHLVVGPRKEADKLIPLGARIEGFDFSYSGIQKAKRRLEQSSLLGSIAQQ